MQIHDIKQGTDAWLRLREEHLTASDASAMMGASKYKSRTQLLKEKKFGVKEVITPAKQALFNKGHAAEDAARELLEVDTLESFAPVVGSIEIDGLNLLASLDGRSEDGDIVFEHKLWNATLAENVRNTVLEPSHYWQLEHQLLVSSAEQVLFMVSDGTAENREVMYYASVPDRRDQLIAGWKQFKQDLDAFEMEAKQEAVIATQAQLPSITYSVKGTEISTNIGLCLNQIKILAEDEMSKTLETDQDFADKDQLNKDVKKARANLKDMVAKVRGEFVSYSQFEEIAQDMDAVLQKMQSHGEKQVTQAKEAKKQSILEDAVRDLDLHFVECNAKIAPMYIQNIINVQPDWVGAIKNKRTIESLTNAVSEELAKCKVEINQVIDRVVPNIKFLRDNAQSHRFLFADSQSLVNQSEESFAAVVNARINEHKKSEEERIEVERKRIQAEEQAKAEAKAKAEAEELAEKERERIRSEERAKAQAEQAKKQQDEHRTAKDARDQRQEDIVDGNPEVALEKSAGINRTSTPAEVLASMGVASDLIKGEVTQEAYDAAFNDGDKASLLTYEDILEEGTINLFVNGFFLTSCSYEDEAELAYSWCNKIFMAGFNAAK